MNGLSSAYPSMAPNLAGQEDLGFWSFGGRMAGTPCISVGRLEANTSTVRDGNYGGVLVLFSEAGDQVIVLSALTNFMVHNLKHRVNEVKNKHTKMNK